MKSQKSMWNSLADSWNKFRNTPRKEAIDFAASLTGKKRILDVGCGNARNLLPFAGNELYGIDFSENMIIAARKFCRTHDLKVKLKVADAKKLPYKKDYFDVVLCMAVLHHFSPTLQRAVLKEIKRVMKPGALLLLTVWHKKSYGTNYIPWKIGDKVHQRYYYFFKKPELKKLLRDVGFSVSSIKTSGEKEKNIVVLARKIAD